MDIIEAEIKETERRQDEVDKKHEVLLEAQKKRFAELERIQGLMRELLKKPKDTWNEAENDFNTRVEAAREPMRIEIEQAAAILNALQREYTLYEKELEELDKRRAALVKQNAQNVKLEFYDEEDPMYEAHIFITLIDTKVDNKKYGRHRY